MSWAWETCRFGASRENRYREGRFLPEACRFDAPRENRRTSRGVLLRAGRACEAGLRGESGVGLPPGRLSFCRLLLFDRNHRV